MTDWDGLDRLVAAERERIVRGLIDFLRLNTVSQEPERVRAGGEWLLDAMRSRGLDARMLETEGNPAVFGERRVPGAQRTVLIYCHYDTKPIPLAGWLQPSPLEPVLRRGLAEDGARPSRSNPSLCAICPTIGSTRGAPPTTRAPSGATSRLSASWTRSTSLPP